MVSDQLIQKLKSVVRSIDEPFDLTEGVLVPAGRNYVLNKYLSYYLGVTETEKESLINRMFGAWHAWGTRRGFGNRAVRAWGRATIGAADLFSFTDSGELSRTGKLGLAADVIVRLSRWFQTEGPIWKQMRPHATELVKRVWGNIEDLRRTPGVCEKATAEGPIRIRLGFRFKWEQQGEVVDLDFSLVAEIGV